MNNQTKIIIALIIVILVIAGLVFYYYIFPDIQNYYRSQGAGILMQQQLNEMRCYVSNGTDLRVVPLSKE